MCAFGMLQFHLFVNFSIWLIDSMQPHVKCNSNCIWCGVRARKTIHWTCTNVEQCKRISSCSDKIYSSTYNQLPVSSPLLHSAIYSSNWKSLLPHPADYRNSMIIIIFLHFEIGISFECFWICQLWIRQHSYTALFANFLFIFQVGAEIAFYFYLTSPNGNPNENKLRCARFLIWPH